jgi:hypothetical protein
VFQFIEGMIPLHGFAWKQRDGCGCSVLFLSSTHWAAAVGSPLHEVVRLLTELSSQHEIPAAAELRSVVSVGCAAMSPGCCPTMYACMHAAHVNSIWM